MTTEQVTNMALAVAACALVFNVGAGIISW